MFESDIGYHVVLFLCAGLYVLKVDVAVYKMRKLQKEQAGARFGGWLNLIVGCLLLVSFWIYRRWMW